MTQARLQGIQSAKPILLVVVAAGEVQSVSEIPLRLLDWVFVLFCWMDLEKKGKTPELPCD